MSTFTLYTEYIHEWGVYRRLESVRQINYLYMSEEEQ
jgi:hypothetical protein